MSLFNKLPGTVRAAPGLERVILKKLPLVLLGGIIVPLLVSLGSRLFPPDATVVNVEKYHTTVDILALAGMVTVWSAALTIAIGCFVVVAMKGPAYVADAYPLEDSDRPGPRNPS